MIDYYFNDSLTDCTLEQSIQVMHNRIASYQSKLDQWGAMQHRRQPLWFDTIYKSFVRKGRPPRKVPRFFFVWYGPDESPYSIIADAQAQIVKLQRDLQGRQVR